MSEGATTKGAQEKKRGFFARIALFLRQVVGEMRKVVWPTRDDLWTYFVVVVVFVIAIMAFTGVLDLVFDRLVMWALA